MTSVIVVFSDKDKAINIRNLLVRNGIPVSAICTTGAQVISQTEDYGFGIVVCGVKTLDMMCTELRELLPRNFEMLLLANGHNIDEYAGNGIEGLETPLQVRDLVLRVDQMIQACERRRKKLREAPKQYTDEEKEIIGRAKALLMDSRGLTEEEAHRYIQKNSMENGTGKVETAQKVLMLLKG